MIDHYLALVASVAGIDLICLAVGIGVAALALRHVSIRWAAILLAYVLVDDALGLMPISFRLNPGQWNWVGQTISVALALLMTRVLLSSEEVGLRLPRSSREWYWTVGGIVAALTVATWPAIFAPGERPTAETLLYQASLPGITEELVVRGVVFALLARTLAHSGDTKPATVAAAAITVAWFTAGHVFRVEDSHIVAVWRRVLDVAPMATIYIVTRLRSRSLLGDTLAHNAANTLVELVALYRF